ncbi:MAG: hypothetical protein ACYCXG_10750 [Acidiferrobacter sp.]
MTIEATLTRKGQTTIPQEIRDSLGMKARERMTVTLMPDAPVVLRLKSKRLTERAGRRLGVTRPLCRIEARSGLLAAADVQREDESTIEQAFFTWTDTAADFADCVLGAKNRRPGCQVTASFDARASKWPGFMAADPFCSFLEQGVALYVRVTRRDRNTSLGGWLRTGQEPLTRVN